MHQKLVGRRLIAVLVILCIVMVSLLSIYFITSRSEHNHTGECCPICEQINDCIHVLHQITGLCSFVFILLVMSRLLTLAPFIKESFLANKSSLVGLKVQMNN